MKKQAKKLFHWDNFIYELKHPSILTKSLITKAVDKFWESHFDKIKDNQHIILLFRAENSYGTYFTLNKLMRLNKSDKQYWINIIMDTLDIKSNDYKEEAVLKIVISFGIRDGVAPLTSKKIISPVKHYQNYKHYKLPVTMDPLKYGSNPVYAMNNTYIVSITPLTTAKIKVNKKATENNVEIFKSGNVVLAYKDKLIDESKFERFIGDNHYIYHKVEGKYVLELFTVKKPSRKIKTLEEEKNLSNKTITLDIETYKDNGKMIPYLVSWVSGIGSNNYYLTDFNNSPDLMMMKAISDLMKVKFNGYKIYIHNLAQFDSVFLIKHLLKLGLLTPTINKDKIINLTLSFMKKKEDNIYFLHFRDSLQLLLSSLRKLAKSFNVDTQKGIFPHRFVNKDNLNYIGAVPPFEFFDGITHNEYLDYCTNFENNWSLRDEAIKYCRADCLSLYQVMGKFIEMIFELYKINVNKYSTLSSLAFALFRTHHIEKVFIPMLSGHTSKQIRTAYTGGSTDMFIPSNNLNELVYCYDVNGLYAHIMAKYRMPVGKPTYFEGDIRKYQPNAFGFFYCKIEAPDNLIHPLLQTHVKTKGGMRTVAALGTYEDMIFSEEMDNAIKRGYKFEILWGYTFKKAFVFRDFINKLYNIRIKYPKEHPMNFIHKIIMNSLYGRFGMNENFSDSVFIVKEFYPKYEEMNFNRILDVKSIGDNFLVEIEVDDTRTKLDNGSQTHNISIAIAAAISSYARIVMSQFKNNPKLKLFYTDTDSIHTNLNPEQMNELIADIVDSKELGKLKLENVAERAIYIAPKCYYLKTIEKQEIYKVKGLNKKVALSQEDFENLLLKDSSITKEQSKWFKSFDEATIEFKEQLYTIKQTDNKRELIYNSDNKLIATKPYVITKDKIIK